jgi:release factor glutamine methyltransferase
MIASAADAIIDCRTIGEAYAALNVFLAETGIREHELDARLLVLAAFKIAHIDLVLRPDAQASSAGLAQLREYGRRRASHEPVTRILGARGFWNFELSVHPDVLDPRPDSEVLIEACLDSLGSRINDELMILDVGTGSGALIAALLTECPKARGWAIDLSPYAIAAAKENLDRLGLTGRVTLQHQSWSTPLPLKYDLVVSNPPYIETQTIGGLEPEVRDFDPHLALDGGRDGLDAYRFLASHCGAWLNADGLLAVEIGASQAAQVARLFRDAGRELVEVRKDYAGRDRAMVWAAASV